MLLTAHGGALDSGRNSRRFFDIIRSYAADVIEVDIYKRRELLYISHLPKLFPRRALTLEYVFDYIKEYDFMVNCDVKMKGLVKTIMDLARKKGVGDRIIFTGSVSRNDLQYLDEAQAYLNVSFFKIKPITENLATIKQIIDTQNSDNIKGLNLNYRYCNQRMLDEAERIGLKLSLFTVDDIKELDRLLMRKELANITTNRIDYVLDAAAKIRYNELAEPDITNKHT